MEFSKWVAYANGYDKNSKVSRLKQWQQVEKTTGIKPEAYSDKPELDEKLHYLWSTYLEIKRGVERISYTELNNYTIVTGTLLSSWECLTILKIDEAWRNNG